MPILSVRLSDNVCLGHLRPAAAQHAGLCNRM